MLVHLSGGYIEAHFHFFVVIVVLTLYEDWLSFALAMAYVVAHHGLVGVADPGAVYNHPDALAHPWKWALVHGLFVGAAGAAAVVSWRMNEGPRERGGSVATCAGEPAGRRAQEPVRRHGVARAANALTSISGFAQTLLDREDQLSDDHRRMFIEIIAEQSERLGQLVNDLLTVSRIESGPAVSEARETTAACPA